MEISFMVSKTGTRILPKPKPQSRSALEDNDKVDVPPQLHQIQSPSTRKRSVDDTEHVAGILDAEEVSFILNIFPDGYTIKNPSEGNLSHQNTAQNDPNLLCPYNKTSESLFAAIDCGRLPADFLDDIHFKYSNGAVVCEVRDYRRDSCEQGVSGLFTVSSPSITKISLKMSLDNVVKDIDQFSDNAWTYGDTMEAESRVLKDPTPNLTRLCNSLKLNLNISGIRRKRLRQIYGAVTVSDNNLEKVINTQQDPVNCMSKVPSSVGNIIGPLTFSTHVGKENDKRILERFSRIRMWTESLQLNRKKYKIDKYKKTRGFTLPTQHLAHFFHSNDVTFKDETRSLLYQQQQFSIIGSNHLKLNIQQQEVEILQKQQEGENQRKMVMMEMEMGQQSKTNVTRGLYGNISDVLMMDYGGTMDSFSALNLG